MRRAAARLACLLVILAVDRLTHRHCHTPTQTTHVPGPMFSKLFGGKKDGDGGKEFAGDAGELWYIEGKAYDLAKFLKAHPGEPSVDRSIDAFGYTTCLPPCVCASRF